MPNSWGEPIREELRAGSSPAAAVAQYASQLAEQHREDVRRHGLKRIADDLVARSLITTQQELVAFEKIFTDPRSLSARRDAEIRAKVIGFFGGEKAAVSLVLEHDGLFFAVDANQNVSQPFATQGAAQSMADRMGQQVIEDRGFEDQMLEDPRLQRELKDGRR